MVGLVIKCVPTLERDIVFQHNWFKTGLSSYAPKTTLFPTYPYPYVTHVYLCTYYIYVRVILAFSPKMAPIFQNPKQSENRVWNTPYL
jgi:hypothetical protein